MTEPSSSEDEGAQDEIDDPDKVKDDKDTTVSAVEISAPPSLSLEDDEKQQMSKKSGLKFEFNTSLYNID